MLTTLLFALKIICFENRKKCEGNLTDYLL